MSSSDPAARRPSPSVPWTYVDANRLWVDSRVRAAAQRRFEAPVLRRLGGPVPGGHVLELGTGRRGTGLRLALELFDAARADGLELHPRSVAVCRRAVADLGDRVRVEQGDATRLAHPDASYDAVFGYHVLHHALGWREAVREASRVLRPGGRLYVAEMTARFVDSRLLRAVSFHPDDGDRPTSRSIAAACTDAGLRVAAQETRFAGLWTALVAVRE
ncbi:class I SAM-dependent methyltransferase [Blastococcus deserti]|uniref:Class I SAM-dependent methyltransferase n=1 Tax=Blastococcus deserti TaxID=2259033 RepID=A0ABW4X8C7_9ACTN